METGMVSSEQVPAEHVAQNMQHWEFSEVIQPLARLQRAVCFIG
jgi:hypothetical protein